MNHYRLTFGSDRFGEPKQVAFTADDPLAVLYVVPDEDRGRLGEVWCEDRRLFRVRRSHAPGDVWQINPPF